MPIERCTLPSGELGFKWGEHGHCYPSRAGAVAQATAAYANGYTEKDDHEHVFSYASGQAKCKCGKFLQPDGRITDTMSGR